MKGKISTTVYLDKDLHKKARKFALERGTTFTEVVERGLRKLIESEGRVVRIVSHRSPRHMDDFLAICVMKSAYSQAEVEYVSPQSVPIEYYLEATDTVVIDVGGRYEKEKLNFDHHQDQLLPSSIALVLNYLTGINLQSLLEIPFLLSIDYIDRFGINKAIKENLVKEDKEVDSIRNIILQTEITQPVADIVSKTIHKAIEKKLTYEDFIYSLKQSLEGTQEYKKAEEKIKQEEERYQQIKKSIKQFSIDEAIVLCSTETVAPNVFRLLSETQADILVERNSQNKNHTSLIVNTQKADLEKLYSIRDKISEDEEIVFQHPNRFIVVINQTPEKVAEKVASLSK